MSAAAVVGFDPVRDKSYRSTRLGRDIVDFLAWCELGGMSPKTLINYEPDLARGALMFPDKGIEDITGGDLLHIARVFPPKSRRARMSAWRSFYKWARRTRKVRENPCDELPEFKRNPQRILPIFSEAEQDAILELPVRDAAPAAILLEAGLRKAEASRLKLKHCDRGTVYVFNGKGGRDREVPASAMLQHLIRKLVNHDGLTADDHIFYAVKSNQYGGKKILRDKPVGEATFARWWRKALLDAGVEYRNPHVARHTFATRWRLKGLGIDDLQLLLGHSNINTTASIYVHTRMADVAERMRVLEGAEV